MTEDHHQFKERLETAHENIQKSEDIREENKKLAEQFKDWNSLRSTSYSRQYRYLSSLKQVLDYNDFRLDNLEEDTESKRKLHKVLSQIENSAYYSKEYAIKTKMEFKSMIKRLLEFHELSSDPEESPLLPQGFKAYVPEKDKKKTDPSDLPTPSDVKKLTRKLEANSRGLTSIRDPTILLTLWDTGARIGECLNIKVGGVKVNPQSVILRVPGNKDSPDRDVPCTVAAPMIKFWLEHGHPEPDNPDAYLFCNIGNGEPEKPVSYRSYSQKVKRVAKKTDLNCKLKGETNHVWRKGRISYLKKADIMNETMIDKRVGHVQGSDQTRVYTRINDEQAGNAYLQGYGLEDEITDQIEEDVIPFECNCGTINSGHRLSCRRCGTVLDEDNYIQGVEQEDPELEEKAEQVEERMMEEQLAINDENLNQKVKEVVAESYGVKASDL